MRISIDVHAVTYAPWEEGADERERLSEQTEEWTFDSARECADWLEREGFGEPSVSPGPYDWRTWVSELTPHEHPYTGCLTERTAHQTHADPRVWAAIVASVCNRWTRYAGPYFAA